MDTITIYSMEGCPFCVKAKSFLTEKGIGFSEVEISPGSKEWKEMKERTGSNFPPQVLVRDEPIGGYSDLVNLYTTQQGN